MRGFEVPELLGMPLSHSGTYPGNSLGYALNSYTPHAVFSYSNGNRILVGWQRQKLRKTHRSICPVFHLCYLGRGQSFEADGIRQGRNS